jgi:saccharopine dehydrogenase-like NADP-dependent oxidoreductase
MPDSIAASGVVHWLGTGLSTGSGLGVLCDRADQVLVWGRSVAKADQCLDRLGLSGRAKTRIFTPAALAGTIRVGDIVVSMLPAAEHAALARLCVTGGAHFACSSYTADELAALSPAAEPAGLVILTEAGLDPGIDHALAHALVARARAAVGTGPATARFTSYCGGLPAVPNEFRYRFSWAPQAVLSALRSPARYLESGQLRTAERPWEVTQPYLLGGERFEVYPNRDSLPFLDQYQFPAAWHTRTFVRGTLRLDGWRQAWAPVFEVLGAGDPAQIDLLTKNLMARYPMTAADRDRVVLAVHLAVQAADGGEWEGRYLLDVTGDVGENAMARTVSLPLAFGVQAILDGRLPAGLHRGARDAAEAERWIAFLRSRGVNCVLRTSLPEETG